jgi:hypothetical protein
VGTGRRDCIAHERRKQPDSLPRLHRLLRARLVYRRRFLPGQHRAHAGNDRHQHGRSVDNKRADACQRNEPGTPVGLLPRNRLVRGRWRLLQRALRGPDHPKTNGRNVGTTGHRHYAPVKRPKRGSRQSHLGVLPGAGIMRHSRRLLRHVTLRAGNDRERSVRRRLA